MTHLVRNAFPYLALALCAGAVAWAISFGTLPRAEFTFNNEDEVKTVDPAKASGTPEHRILTAIYEGLLNLLPADTSPDQEGVVPLVVKPGVAELPEISPDGTVYTFKLRPNAKWSNGDPVTAHDFVWSWRRTLHPDTASEYSYQLHYIAGAKKYGSMQVEIGDRVEVELPDRRDDLQPFPRGTMVYGVIRDIVKSPPPPLLEAASEEEKSDAEANWKRTWVYLVEEKARGKDGDVQVDWEGPGKIAAFCPEPPLGEWRYDQDGLRFTGTVTGCKHVLPHFDSTVGARAVNDHTLVVTLTNPTPFFSELLTFYPLYPVNRKCVETHGTPEWTKPENIVSNGPFLLQSRRIRDRIRLVKNPNYWNAKTISLNVVDALPIKSRITALNMYLKGELDWNHAPPGNMIPLLKDREDYISGPALLTYFYRLNVQRKGLDDKRVRQALNLAMNKQQICSYVTQAGERPARSLVPLGMPGYEPAFCGEYAPERAKALLAEAGYPNGRGFPKVEILFNSDETHKAIAEVIQQQWKQTLGINVDLRGIAWPAYLDAMLKVDFDICRAGWVPDYTDPNTFLDMFVTNGTHNNTNWGNPRYDELIAAAAKEPDVQQRARILQEAEQILMDEQPIIPIYYYVTKNLVKPRVKNWFPNPQDTNPIAALRVEGSASGSK